MKNISIGLLIIFCFLFSLTAKADFSHIVDRGESLGSIAKKYGVSEGEIIRLNPDAAQFVYVGMELIIPGNENSQSTSTVITTSEGENLTVTGTETGPNLNENIYYSSSESNKNIPSAQEEDSFESERQSNFIEFLYTATSFKDVKSSGSYGIGLIMLPWNITNKLYGGFYFSPANLNFGLMPSDYAGDIIKLGPSIGYYITPKIAVILPVAVDCYLWNFGDKVKTSWSMEISPSIYVGKTAGVFIGPVLGIPFQGGEASVGFRVGIYI